MALAWFAQPVMAEAVSSPKRVLVGGYPFPPFVDKAGGVTLDLIAAMNAFQSDYQFVFVPTSAGRRYKDLADGRFSLIFFESQAWGWDSRQVEQSRVYLRGDGEVYVALAADGRNQKFFDNLGQRSLIGVNGYHYGFADFNADQKALNKKFRITFADDSEAMMRMLIKQRGEVAVVTRSYLQSYLQTHSEFKDKFLISTRMDQAYSHTVLLRAGQSSPSVQEIDKLLDAMERAGVLKKLWHKYGINNP